MKGFERSFLGQVQLVTGPSTTPFYNYPPYGYFANPSGNPLMTEELTSPQTEHLAREFHCYRKPDGSFVSVPFAQSDAAKAAGYEATDYSNCGTPPHAQPVGTGSFIAGKREENMFDKKPFLGQVPLRGMGQAQMRAGTGFMGPFGMYSDMPHPEGNAPAGFPATTVEEIQTYVCPDGSRQNMTRAEAAAQGCTLAPPTGPYARSAAPAYMMGQPASSGPSSPGTSAAPAGTPGGNQIAAVGAQPQFTNESFPNFFPGYFPGYYPPPAAPASKLTCKRHVNPDTGEETFECEPKAEPAPAPTYRYPVYFVNPFFY